MASDREPQPVSKPADLSLDDLDQVVGGTGAAATTGTPSMSKEEQTFLTGLQQNIDLGTESATAAVKDAQTFATQQGMMHDQVLLDLRTALTGDQLGTASASLTAVNSQISLDVGKGGSLAQDAIHALQATGATGATATSVENTVALAAAAGGGSMDAVFAQISGQVHGGHDGTAAAQFTQDLTTRVTSGDAAAGLAADFAAGHVTAAAALDALHQEAHAGGVASNSTHSDKLEGAFLSDLQQRIDNGTEATTSVVRDVQNYARDAGLLRDDVLVSLGQNLAGTSGGHADTNANAEAALTVVTTQLAQDITGTTTTTHVQAQGYIPEHTVTTTTGMLTDAANALQGQAHLSASAATVEHMLAGAAALTGQSADALLSNVAQHLGNPSHLTGDAAQFITDLQARVTSGTAATDLAADIAAGAVTEVRAAAILRDEETATGGTGAHAMTELLTVQAATLATAVANGSLSVQDAATALSTDGQAFPTASTVTAELALYRSVVANDSAQATTALQHAIDTGNRDPSVFGSITGAEGQADAAAKLAVGGVLRSLSGADAALVTLATDTTLGSTAVSFIADRITSGDAAAGLAADIAAGHVSVAQALSTLSSEVQLSHPGKGAMTTDQQGFTLLNALVQNTQATTAEVATLANSVATNIVSERSYGAGSASAIASYVDGLATKGSLSGAATVVLAEAVGTAAHANVDVILADMLTKAETYRSGTAHVADLEAAINTEAAARVNSGAAAAELAADVAAGRLSEAAAMAAIRHEGAAAGLTNDQADAALLQAQSNTLLTAVTNGSMSVQDAATALARDAQSMSPSTAVAAELTLYNAVKANDAAQATTALQHAVAAGNRDPSVFANITSMQSQSDAAAWQGIEGAIRTIQGADAALVTLSTDATLGTNAVAIIADRIKSGDAATAIAAEIASGHLTATQAVATFASEVHLAHPGKGAMSTDQQGFTLLNAVVQNGQASGAELWSLASSVASTIVTEQKFGAASWSDVATYTEALASNGTLSSTATVALAEATATAAHTSVDLTLVGMSDDANGGSGSANLQSLQGAIQTEVAARIASGAAGADFAAALAAGDSHARVLHAIAVEGRIGTTAAADMEAALTTLAQGAGVSTEEAFYHAAAQVGGRPDPQSTQFMLDYVQRLNSGAAMSQIAADMAGAHPKLTMAQAISLAEGEAGLLGVSSDALLVQLLPHDNSAGAIAAAITARINNGSFANEMASNLNNGTMTTQAVEAAIQTIATAMNLPASGLLTHVYDALESGATGAQALGFQADFASSFITTEIKSYASQVDAGTLTATDALDNVAGVWYGNGLPKSVTLVDAYQALIAASTTGKSALIDTLATYLEADLNDQSITPTQAINLITGLATSQGMIVDVELAKLAQATATGASSQGMDPAALASLQATHNSVMLTLESHWNDGTFAGNMVQLLGNGGLNAAGAEAAIQTVAAGLGTDSAGQLAQLFSHFSVQQGAGGTFNGVYYPPTLQFTATTDNANITNAMNSLSQDQIYTLGAQLNQISADVYHAITSGTAAHDMVQQWVNVQNSGAPGTLSMATMISDLQSLSNIAELYGSLVKPTDFTGLGHEQQEVSLAQAAWNAGTQGQGLSQLLETDIASRVNSGTALTQLWNDLLGSEHGNVSFWGNLHGTGETMNAATAVAQTYAQEVAIAQMHSEANRLVAAKGNSDAADSIALDIAGSAANPAVQYGVLYTAALHGVTQAQAEAMTHNAANSGLVTLASQAAELGFFRMVESHDADTDANQGAAQAALDWMSNSAMRTDLLTMLGADSQAHAADFGDNQRLAERILRDSNSGNDSTLSDAANQTNLGNDIATISNGSKFSTGFAAVDDVIGAVAAFKGSDNQAGISDLLSSAVEIAARGVPLVGVGLKIAGGLDAVAGTDFLNSTVAKALPDWASGGELEAVGAGSVMTAVMVMGVLNFAVDSIWGADSAGGQLIGTFNDIASSVNDLINGIISGTVATTVESAKDIGNGLAELFTGNASSAATDFENAGIELATGLGTTILNSLEASLNDLGTALSNMQALGASMDAGNPYNRPGGIFG